MIIIIIITIKWPFVKADAGMSVIISSFVIVKKNLDFHSVCVNGTD
jgi:hypothetical protein